MKTQTIISLLILSLFSLNLCDDQIATFNNVTVHALQASGQLLISYAVNETNFDTVTVTLNSLSEKNQNGTVVGGADHTVNFSGLTFTVSNFTNGTLNNVSALLSDLTVTDFSKNQKAALDVKVYLFTEEGTITTGDAKKTVKPGFVKFIYGVSNWQFCKNLTTPCEGVNCCVKQEQNVTEVGSFLDLVFTVKGSKNATKENSLKFDLGNSDLTLSNFIQLDGGNFTKLTSSYPAYERTDNKDVFTVRIPTFEKTAVYDPYVEMDGLKKPSNVWLVVGIIVGIVAIAVVVFAVLKCFKNGSKSEPLMP
jgi:hypothetical protein